MYSLRIINYLEYAHSPGINTTTENLSRYLHDRISAQMQGLFNETLRVMLHEGRVASATYEAKFVAVRRRPRKRAAIGPTHA